MKSLFSVLLFSILILGTVKAAYVDSFQSKVEKRSVLFDKDNHENIQNDDSKGYLELNFLPSTSYNAGFTGTTHRRWDTDQIAYNPDQYIYSTLFDYKSLAGAKSLGLMVGRQGEHESYLLNGSDISGTWYANPDITGIDNYIIAILPHEGATGPWLKIAVYSHNEEGWSNPVTVQAVNGASPEKVHHAHGAITKDSAGYYYLLITTAHKFVGYNNREQSIIVGKTADPFNGPWEFTDFNQNLIKTSNVGQFSETVCDFKAAWGKNGFGIAVMGGKQAADTSKLGVMGYTYTRDYGQTWSKANTSGDMHIIPMDQQMFPWVGTLTGGNDPFVIPRTSIGDNLDLVVDDNNTVHIVDFVWAGANSNGNYYPYLQKNADGVLVNGYYHIAKKFDATGNPKEHSWRANFIAQPVGYLDEDTPDEATEPAIEKKYSNTKYASLSDAGDGKLVVQWVDRPRGKNILDETAFGALVGITGQSNDYTYILNPYISLSSNEGLSWMHSNDDTEQTTKLAFEIKTYPDVKTHELGFKIAPKSRIINGVIETYASYGIPNLQLPSPSAVVAPATPGSRHDLWEQNWYVMKLLIGPYYPGIETENISINKDFTLAHNYPNPFNPTTTITFFNPDVKKIKVAIYNAKGELVKELFNDITSAGMQSIKFDANGLNSGVYFYRLSSGNKSLTKKMLMVK